MKFSHCKCNFFLGGITRFYVQQTHEPLLLIIIGMSSLLCIESGYQSLLTLCKLDKSSSNSDSFTIKVLKQKLLIDSMEYLLHDIYGIENKAVPKSVRLAHAFNQKFFHIQMNVQIQALCCGISWNFLIYLSIKPVPKVWLTCSHS